MKTAAASFDVRATRLHILDEVRRQEPKAAPNQLQTLGTLGSQFVSNAPSEHQT